MSTNHTPNYGLNQWEPEDRVLREDFNADNARLDAALTALAEADAAEAAARQAVANRLYQKGNCLIYTATYRGTGLAGADNPCRVSCPGTPLLLVLISPQSGNFTLMMNPCTMAQISSVYIHVKWEGSTVSWYTNNNASYQFNEAGQTYTVLALIATS